MHPDQIVAAASLAGIEELPTEPEKLNALLQNPSHRLHKLRGILGNEEVDNLLKKLPEQFDFIVAQLAVVLKELSDTYNMSSGQSQLDAYEKARNRYLEFVEDLDTRHLPKRAVNFQKKGYGKPIKWVDVLPAVEAGSTLGII